jgi:hypothetical protein
VFSQNSSLAVVQESGERGEAGCAGQPQPGMKTVIFPLSALGSHWVVLTGWGVGGGPHQLDGLTSARLSFLKGGPKRAHGGRGLHDCLPCSPRQEPGR